MARQTAEQIFSLLTTIDMPAAARDYMNTVAEEAAAEAARLAETQPLSTSQDAEFQGGIVPVTD